MLITSTLADRAMTINYKSRTIKWAYRPYSIIKWYSLRVCPVISLLG